MKDMIKILGAFAITGVVLVALALIDRAITIFLYYAVGCIVAFIIGPILMLASVAAALYLICWLYDLFG